MLYKFRCAVARWMYGRNGVDQLNRALVWVYLAIWLLEIVCSVLKIGFLASVFEMLVFFLLAVVLFRTFSKNLVRRRRELAFYYKIKNAPRRARQLRKNKKRDKKTHCYFKCPKCRSVLRVPRGKGEIIVTCPRCGERTEKKT